MLRLSSGFLPGNESRFADFILWQLPNHPVLTPAGRHFANDHW